MNRLSEQKQASVLSLLVEGNSIRSTERITGIHRDTIMRLLVRSGEKAAKILDSKMRNLSCSYVQLDELWCFVQKKRKAVNALGIENPFIGDQWVFCAIDAETKAIIDYVVGKRNLELSDRIMEGLRDRITNRFQLSSDAFQPYRLSAYRYLGGECDYGQVIKSYGGVERGQEARYSPPKILSVTIRPVMGNPDYRHISTSYIERQNLTIRMQSRRFTRLTNGFSKKLENLQAAVSLHFFHYNFMRVHRSLRCTPAMAQGVSGSIWTWEDFFAGERTRERLAA